MATHTVKNGRIALALHERKGGEGTALLLLHPLYASSDHWGPEVDAWPGPVLALDFSGHGASDRVRGGAYHYERMLSDADLALRHVGTAALAGAGMGAWYALILAGTRTDRVPACLLGPGCGLEGGGPEPDPMDVRPVLPTAQAIEAFAASGRAGDPYTQALEHDPRPPWFAEPFIAAARRLVLWEDGGETPPWWDAVRASGAERVPGGLAAGLALVARGL